MCLSALPRVSGSCHAGRMAPEMNDGGAVSVMDEEPLRPPESWPGAGGLKSVAPEIPSWPTGPLPRAATAAASAPPAPRPTGTGEGWPGASGPVVEPKAQAPPSDAAPGAPESRRDRTRKPAGHAPIGASLVLLLACLAIAAWVLLDDGSRVLQASVLAVVLLAGGVFVARTVRRNRRAE